MEFVNLLDICNVYQPKTISTKYFIENGEYNVYGANGIIGKYDEYNHKDSEILMACRGASCGAINVSKPYSWINGNAMVVSPKDTKDVNKTYLKYMLMSVPKGKIISGTAQPQITRQNLSKFKVPLCSLEEQKRIVSRIEELFSELDNGVGNLKKAKTQLDVYRQAVLKEAFDIDKINGKSGVLLDVIVEKPRNGYSVKAVNYSTKFKNLTLTATTSGYFKNNCFKYVDIDIDNDSYLWLKKNDILIQRANTIDYVGISALYKGEDNQYIYPDLMMKIKVKNGINPSFILYQLHLAKNNLYYRNNATGTAGSMPKINQKVVSETPIIILDESEQNKIVEKIEEKISACENIEKTIDTALQQAETMRQSILKQAFEGKL